MSLGKKKQQNLERLENTREKLLDLWNIANKKVDELKIDVYADCYITTEGTFQPIYVTSEKGYIDSAVEEVCKSYDLSLILIKAIEYVEEDIKKLQN